VSSRLAYSWLYASNAKTGPSGAPNEPLSLATSGRSCSCLGQRASIHRPSALAASCDPSAPSFPAHPWPADTFRRFDHEGHAAGGKCVLASARQPLRVIAGRPYRGRVQAAGDDLQLPLHQATAVGFIGLAPRGRHMATANGVDVGLRLGGQRHAVTVDACDPDYEDAL
jgi:hypothetical protein